MANGFEFLEYSEKTHPLANLVDLAQAAHGTISTPASQETQDFYQETFGLFETFVLTVENEHNRPVGLSQFEFDSESKEAELHILAIDAGYRGCGLGRLLLRCTEMRILTTGAEVIVVSAQPSAVDFYTTSGYSQLGDAILEKRLP